MLLALVCGVIAALALAPTSQAGTQNCPERSYLELGGIYYESQPVPDTVTLPQGTGVGTVTVDQPRGFDPCKREQIDADVYSIEGVDPSLAVLVPDAKSPAFILGSRCSGYDDDAARWQCILEPLLYGGVRYTAIRYPRGVPPADRLLPGADLGEGSIAGQMLVVQEIDGVDPASAVAARGRPGEVFVAPGVCPYERPAEEAAFDDLSRCLQGPIWFTFTPLGTVVGGTVVARGDRPAPPELDGASIGLVPLSTPADALPDDLGALTPIATLDPDADGSVSLSLAVPDLPAGRYEAVARCEACAEAHDGQTVFPAGSFTVLEEAEKKSGSRSAKIVYIIVFGLLMLAIAGAIVLFVRGRRRRGRPAT